VNKKDTLKSVQSNGCTSYHLTSIAVLVVMLLSLTTACEQAKRATATRELPTPDAIEYYNLGVEYLERDKLDLAIEGFTGAILLRSDYAEAYHGRGIAHTQTGDYDQAIVDFRRYLEVDPDTEHRQTVEEWITALEAELSAKRATATSESPTPDAIEYYNLGVEYLERGKLDLAIEGFTKAIQLRSDYAEAYHGRGIAYAHKGEYNRAIADCNQAIQIQPDYIEAYNNCGVAYSDSGEYSHAISMFSKAIQINPNHAEVYYGRGYAYLSSDEYDQAIVDFSKAIQLDAGYALAYINRGVAHTKTGDYDQAIVDLRRYLEVDPDTELRQTVEGWIAALEAEISAP